MSIVTIKITEDQKKRARKLYEFNVLNGSVTEGEGNEVGALGEIIVLDYYGDKAEYVGDYNYDMIIKGKKVDVKTKKQAVIPQPTHKANIFAYNTKQQCDYYCFVAIHTSLKKGWILGWKEKEKFFNEATFRKGGEVDETGNNKGWVFKSDCYVMTNADLDWGVKS
jgi:hypothetical protein